MRPSHVGSRSLFTFGFAVLAACLYSPHYTRAQATSPSMPINIVIQHDVPMKTRDGVVLYADIYRPRSSDKFPVILMRTPYDKSANWAVSPVFKMVPRGYVVIIQDVRGRYTSEGEWYPFKHEQADGYDTVEWAAALPYSDGRVGMIGASYVGATQMLAGIAQPPHLTAIAPNMTASNYHDGWTYQGGAFEQWFDQNWTSQLAQNTLQRLIDQNTNALVGAPALPLADYPVFNFGQLPADAHLTAAIAPYYLDWLAHPDYDDYWKQWSIEEHFSNIAVPMLQVGGWYDIFNAGTLRNYLGAKTHGSTDAARTQQHLLIEIGGHAGFGRRIGDVDFGPHATENVYTDVILDWYDFILKGIANEFATDKPVKVFVMGANEYRQEDDWPPPQAQLTKYFLHSAGKSNSLAGDGSLSASAPKNELPDTYVYNPASPVPSVGGPLCCDANHMEPGPRDQRSVENRDDVLVYSTGPLPRDLEVTGPVTAELFVKSSAVDTDFTAKLVDVAPDGFAQDLTEGILRMRYHASPEHATLINPGQIYEISLDLWATSNVFLRGHSLRLEISSSNFPRFDRNLNTGEEIKFARSFVAAKNTILHDAQHPSALVLPIMPSK
ncbi:MAG: hydrolase, CocE/NonD family [Acidobacteriaceae bacterium]|jgi:putative CocE/NonD family hydrolase|nr:hydrolase, CocE/NonD family [Acidobacteriaceae bacterium]